MELLSVLSLHSGNLNLSANQKCEDVEAALLAPFPPEQLLFELAFFYLEKQFNCNTAYTFGECSN